MTGLIYMQPKTEFTKKQNLLSIRWIFRRFFNSRPGQCYFFPKILDLVLLFDGFFIKILIIHWQVGIFSGFFLF